MMRPMGLCYQCKHWKDNNEADEPVCDAYPDGIPVQILEGRMDHTVPQVGDHGILFEKEAGVSDEHVERILARMRS
jgi:hypothetical protein